LLEGLNTDRKKLREARAYQTDILALAFQALSEKPGKQISESKDDLRRHHNRKAYKLGNRAISSIDRM
jgi:hypothetical protein